MQITKKSSENINTIILKDEVKNLSFKIIDNHSNGDIYIKLDGGLFSVEGSSFVFDTFNLFIKETERLNQNPLNQMSFVRKEYGDNCIVSDDDTEDFATILAFKAKEDKITFKTKNQSKFEFSQDIVRICFSGTRTQGLYGVARTLINELCRLEKTKANRSQSKEWYWQKFKKW